MRWRSCGILVDMTTLLSEVMRKVAELPHDRQDDAARVLLAMLENDHAPFVLSDQQLREIQAAQREVDVRLFASDAEVAAALNARWA